MQAIYNGNWGAMDVTATANMPAASPYSGLSGFVDSLGNQHFAYMTPDSQVWQAVWNGGWAVTDVSASGGSDGAFMSGPTYDWDVNHGTVTCGSSLNGKCQAVAVGKVWSMPMNTSATCNNGNLVAASITLSAQCYDIAFGDVGAFTTSYPSHVLTASGWIERWIGGLLVTGTASDDIANWTGYDSNFCDMQTRQYLPPDATPC